jgi:antitoxin component YwqK of YwqJK toxin-antitoxin module
MSFKLYSQTDYYIFHFIKISETQAKLQSFQYSSNSSKYFLSEIKYPGVFCINSFHSINGNDFLELKDYHINPDGWFSGFLESFSRNNKKIFSLQFKDGRYSGISKGWFENGVCSYKLNFKNNSSIVITKQFYEYGGLASFLKTKKNHKSEFVVIFEMGWDIHMRLINYYKRKGVFCESLNYNTINVEIPVLRNRFFRKYESKDWNHNSHYSMSNSRCIYNFEKGSGLDYRFCNIYKNESLKFQLFPAGNKLNLPKSPVQRIIKIY